MQEITSFCRRFKNADVRAGADVIRCHLSRLMGERKMKIVDVSRETGLHRNTVTLLYRETAARVDLDAIDKLCELFGCEVGELLERVESNPAPDA